MKKLIAGLCAVILILAGVVIVMIVSPWDNDKTPEDPATGAPFNESVVKSFKISSLTYRYSNVVYN